MPYIWSQGDVAAAVVKMSGEDFSQTTISRFEALKISLSNMAKLRPVLEKWMQENQVRFAGLKTCLGSKVPCALF